MLVVKHQIGVLAGFDRAHPVVDLKLPRPSYRQLPGVARRIVLLTRKTVHELPGFAALHRELAQAIGLHLSWHK